MHEESAHKISDLFQTFDHTLSFYSVCTYNYMYVYAINMYLHYETNVSKLNERFERFLTSVCPDLSYS